MNNSGDNNDFSTNNDEDENIAVDMSEVENSSNEDPLGIHDINKSIISNTFEEDEKTQVVDKATLPLG